MAETLYIRLGSQANNSIQWLILSENSEEIIASGELDNAEQLTELTEKSSHRLVTVFVPSTDIALKSLAVPSKSTRAMKLAAPYMLEDELAQEVEQLFFAYANLQPQNTAEKSETHNCFIAAVDRALVKQWLMWLTQANINCKTMIPDVLAMPLAENNGWSAIVFNQEILVRQGRWQGLSTDIDLWNVIAEQLTNTDDGETTTIEAYSQLPAPTNGSNNNTDTLEHIIIKAQPEELPLALLAHHSKKQPFNLLQGEFLIKEKRSPVLTYWLWAAGVAMFALLFNLSIKGGQIIQLNAQQDLINEKIISQYKKTFPATKRVRINTIKSQLKRKLAQVGGSDSQAGFLAMLTLVRPAFADVPELKPESLKFDGKRQEIRINAVASDYQYFEKFKMSLEKTSLSIKQGGQNNQGDQVSGSFSISSKAVKKKNSKTRGRKS